MFPRGRKPRLLALFRKRAQEICSPAFYRTHSRISCSNHNHNYRIIYMVRVAIATLLAMALISFIPRTIEVSAADEPPERPMDVMDARPLPPQGAPRVHFTSEIAETNRKLGFDMTVIYGWGSYWNCLDKLWIAESGWNHLISNRQGSGAYGIPQSLPGSKMASHGADWKTNPATQIAWGLDYIKARYGTPCGAWSAFLSRSPHWY